MGTHGTPPDKDGARIIKLARSQVKQFVGRLLVQPRHEGARLPSRLPPWATRAITDHEIFFQDSLRQSDNNTSAGAEVAVRRADEMRDSIRESSNRPTGIEVTTELLAKYVLSIMGVVVTVGGFVALIEAHPARVFVKRHPYPFYIGLIVAVLIIMTVLNYALARAKRKCAP